MAAPDGRQHAASEHGVSREPTGFRRRAARLLAGPSSGVKALIVTDTLGLLLTVMVCTASHQDRDGANTVLLATYLTTRVRLLFADAGFTGARLGTDLLAHDRGGGAQTRRSARVRQRGFAVIPRRWVVERSLTWLTAHRRLARDYERYPAVSEAMIHWAAINTMTRRLARGRHATRQQRRIFQPTS